ncbi:MarR family winged helix-turn-helix transcriptional regulator [Streptomyces sp. WG-D5]
MGVGGRAEGADDGSATAATDLRRLAVELRRLNGELTRVVHGFATGQDLHPTDVQALAVVLDSTEPVTPSVLRRRLGLTSGAVSACVDRLERAGHLRRVRESSDRRVVHLQYVSGAQVRARKYFGPLAEAADRVRADFSPEELDVVVRFLGSLNKELTAVESPRS